ncbi:DUF1015 domain-containing protein [Flavobacterium aquatile]|uniref:SpoOJ/ParA/ParB/repB family protein n=1 Tax=Flavobacterium aquatile LMG 4008 = ATCC 11947 TaxID=1453498 RepID=A0A095ST02_9FLAO|nr:DUF1015 domain-containing protein [Flavobacterium aquatile]KGD67484.1 hypothetical protein LG45_14880 [Flavobacterium aquatile LMG 4008 = ATCC 11947]OXA67021.1 hypothetical protein B0A61_09775 [Flavobacterium aquatile LMG 4008 = ATCC 11947]GEC79924.1 hypothetical protein FAQ01_27940 [Flavobacterium aquatile]
MSKIIPFKAVRPTPDKVALVTCRNYDDYSPAELASWLDFNPYSFLHVINPAYVHSQKITLDKRFKGVSLKYQDFKNDGIFMEEEKPVFFLYEIQTKNQSFTGIVAGTSIEDYKNNVIKKHEDTLQYRVELFKDYLHQTGFNTEPVLITYPDNAAVNSWITEKKKEQPIYHFSTTNKEKHTLWKIETDAEITWLENQFEKIPELYIADGHHRSASAELLYDQNKALGNENLNNFMSFLIAESNVKIYEFNRIIRDLNGNSKEDFLQKLSENFIIKSKEQELWKPQSKFEFGMYLDGAFYALFYKLEKNTNSLLENLDAQILYDKVLQPILGIEDLRNDERIEYIPGKQSILTIKELVDEGEFEVGFMLFPSDISEIKALADNNLIMPPKSTYIEPKFRSGLMVYEL